MPAATWAEVALRVLEKEYPHKSGHLAHGPDDVDVTPTRLFPAFHGCLDWHSSVHMQWSLVTLLPGLGGDLRHRVIRLLDARLTAANITSEAAYLRRDPGFERPYGWAWAARLTATAHESSAPEAARWAAALEPLADTIASATVTWLPRLAYPVRHGTHANTAFGLLLLRDAFGRLGRADVIAAIDRHALRLFAADADYALRWEPSGSDFLSPSLCEAVLMQRVLPDFARWLPRFLPGLAEPNCPLFDVPAVLDRTDGQAVHLVGLALSRAWQLRLLAADLEGAASQRCRAAADRLVDSALPEIAGGDFMATHWLVSFALLATGVDTFTA